MSRSMVRNLASTLVVAAVLGIQPARAYADTRSFNDRSGDVRAGTDIINVSVRNEARVVITVRHRDLRHTLWVGINIYFDTTPARSGPDFVFAAGVGDGVDWNVWRANGWKPATGWPLNCALDYSIDFARDLTRASISRSCLNNPGRI